LTSAPSMYALRLPLSFSEKLLLLIHCKSCLIFWEKSCWQCN